MRFVSSRSRKNLLRSISTTPPSIRPLHASMTPRQPTGVAAAWTGAAWSESQRKKAGRFFPRRFRFAGR
eukprot:4314916-Prymnesium_polylepis.1